MPGSARWEMIHGGATYALPPLSVVARGLMSGYGANLSTRSIYDRFLAFSSRTPLIGKDSKGSI